VHKWSWVLPDRLILLLNIDLSSKDANGARTVLIRRLFPILAAALMMNADPAFALQVIEHDQHYFYFPKDEANLAARLTRSVPAITGFLTRHGLAVKTPLHIILDDLRDEPLVNVSMYPRREIRIPLRAPGVLEDGFKEADPWGYFLFMGMSMVGIYGQRSAIPGGLHKVFGEIVSPNLILPGWTIDGISHLLYELYLGRPVTVPLADEIFRSGPIPPLDKVSNHPEVWPGRFGYRIYGRPFIRWLHEFYGWEKIHEFLRLHGAGIVPVEIDRKAYKAFGDSWNTLWKRFSDEKEDLVPNGKGTLVDGFWPAPFVYWNQVGVYPGLSQRARRGRYGYVDAQGWLWLNEYQSGAARLIRRRGNFVQTAAHEHIWDPGPGGVAVTRRGHRPYLMLFGPLDQAQTMDSVSKVIARRRLVAAPPGVIQLSGPVMDTAGRVAVAGNLAGNWDIYLWDGQWYRVTSAPSTQMDPWLAEGRLIFSSNFGGRFQIHSADMRPLTATATAAVLPRGRKYLELGDGGWFPRTLELSDAPDISIFIPIEAEDETIRPPDSGPRDYSPLKSIIPNYVTPDLFLDENNFQFGIATHARDVSGHYAWDAGVRYDIDDKIFSWRIGGRADGFNARATRYPFGFTTGLGQEVDEMRYDYKLGWTPRRLTGLELSGNWRRYWPHDDSEGVENEWWGALGFRRSTGNFKISSNFDWFTNGSQSLYGETTYWFGQEITTVLRLAAGKTWGDLVPGHNSFRIGGYAGEGFFTQRPARLFPLRGFKSNVLDASQAVVGGVEVLWPLARLQTGYHTLPLFLHNISLGTFVDAGLAADRPSSDDLLAGAGFELVTGMELAWGFRSEFRLGWAWPLLQADGLDEAGPIFLIQIGRPL
jgi:hypothetical protein